MIDTHAHLHVSAYDHDRPKVVARSFEAGIRCLLEVNINAGGWPRVRRLAESDPRIFAALGIHPHDTGRAGARDFDRLMRDLDNPRVAALGETGLDYYRNYAPWDTQREFFRRHVRMARESGLPLVVHARDGKGGPSANDEVLDIIEAEGGGHVRGVLHCYSGDLGIAVRAHSLGFLIGLGGGITYNPGKTGPLLQAIAEKTGPGIFVLETDCPYQTPMPHRSERNEPSRLPLVAAALAGYLELDEEQVLEQTTASALRLFGFDRMG